MASLSVGAQLFVFSARQWAVAARGKHCVHGVLKPFYDRYQIPEALPILDEYMALIAATAFRPVSIQRPCRTNLGEDEGLLLEILRCAQRREELGNWSVLDAFFAGPLRTTCARIARAYVDCLLLADLSVTGRRYLALVQTG